MVPRIIKDTVVLHSTQISLNLPARRDNHNVATMEISDHQEIEKGLPLSSDGRPFDENILCRRYKISSSSQNGQEKDDIPVSQTGLTLVQEAYIPTIQKDPDAIVPGAILVKQMPA